MKEHSSRNSSNCFRLTSRFFPTRRRNGQTGFLSKISIRFIPILLYCAASAIVRLILCSIGIILFCFIITSANNEIIASSISIDMMGRKNFSQISGRSSEVIIIHDSFLIYYTDHPREIAPVSIGLVSSSTSRTASPAIHYKAIPSI